MSTGRRWHLSIHTKLIGVTTLLVAAIVAFLTSFFSSREIHELSAEQQMNATVYGDLIALELRSAVAFGDRATAQEVLSSLSVDPEIAATTLFAEDGTVLYQNGRPAKWVERAKAGVMWKRVVHAEGRYSVVAPVVSLEGPRGTLVIELSDKRFYDKQADIVFTAAVLGFAAWVFGALVAWWLSRSLARRLRAINRVATVVASKPEGTEIVDDVHDDEIGVLAAAFNTMLGQLRADRGRLQHMVTELRGAEALLEQRVEQRTAELRTAMDCRAEMEVELRQAQKLESVGRLAAGIAHELNSPIQFVSDSCTFLSEATTALIEADVRTKAAIAETETHEELVAKLDEIRADVNIDDYCENLPSATHLALQGLERVAGIVRAMKEFAYADHHDQAPADLNRAIQNTLMVARNEYKYVADVATDFGDLPAVTCHVGEFNQVVLNIIVNAAHAIEAARESEDERGCISVRTTTDGDTAVIAIEDDGCGIRPEIMDKIFEPFFTTKEIGKGSGQGLAIARSVIVDKHHGKLDVTSVPGKGTTFTIRLPIAGIQPLAAAA